MSEHQVTIDWKRETPDFAYGKGAGNLITSGGLADVNWTVTNENTGALQAAETVYSNNADCYGGWAANGPNSDWIARNANVTNNGPAPYTFYRTFDLTGYNLSTVSISGAWTVDDAGTLSLNGITLATLGDGNWGSLASFSVPTGSSDFVQGLNTLAITITYDDEYLEGVRLQGTLVGTSAVPEPSTLIMSGTMTLIGLGYWWRRRRSATT